METRDDYHEVRSFSYNARLAESIETRWQDRWASEGTFRAPNPIGDLSGDSAAVAKPKKFILDMFPYPSGAGLHVGHPLGYIGTDVYARYLRMTGHNVLHTLGFDAFGLPAEQYAVTTGTHPRVTTLAAINNMRRQLHRLGLGHDDRRSVSTIDPGYYKWTQWIFIKIFNSWFDTGLQAARPIADLIAQFESGERQVPDTDRPWGELTASERSDVLNLYRLAYRSDSPVNWCPGLGTVLANEEVTSEGRSERGNLPVFKARLSQWKMRITAYSDRLIDDLDDLDWPDPIKIQQRNWIGRSDGAEVAFAIGEHSVDAYTTRPDTLFGATYLVLAPEHPLVESIVAAEWPEGTDPSVTGGCETPFEAVGAYQARAASRSERERQTEVKDKTGVFTGAFATNPVNGAALPVFIADYVFMGYGTGAIMAVPAHDQRDFEFARAFRLPVNNVLALEEGWSQDTADWDEAFVPDTGSLVNSANESVSLDGLDIHEAKQRITSWLESHGVGRSAVTYRMRDWLFSRQRYWGEPFPIVYDKDGVAHALPESMLPLELPDVDDYSPRLFDPEDAESVPEAPLGRDVEWVNVTLDLGDGPRPYRRETNTMPNWAGSCWYELRYLDPINDKALVNPEVELYWMGPREGMPRGGVDLYVGGAEHAVLHLLYARFWSKVLFDLGHVSSSEPFHKLYNQGMIQAFVYRDKRGVAVPADEVIEVDGTYFHDGEPVSKTLGKMGKSLKNTVAPDEIFINFGADTLRLYEMAMGPLDVSRPWESRAVIGQHRLLQRIWRNIVDESTGEVVLTDAEPDADTYRLLHHTITDVTREMNDLRFHIAIAKLTELNNHLTKAAKPVPRSVAEPLVLMLAPLAPHIAEEMWALMGHDSTITFAEFPVADAGVGLGEKVSCMIQVNGKVRSVIDVDPDITAEELEQSALRIERIRALVDGCELARVVTRAPNVVNIVVRKH